MSNATYNELEILMIVHFGLCSSNSSTIDHLPKNDGVSFIITILGFLTKI
jgi:hypothetical protein